MHPASERVELAGSARRLADSVKDLDIIATASDPPALLKAFAELDVIESSSSPGPNAARARTHTNVSVDLRVVEPDQFGNLLQHFTGSKAHNMALREAAVRRGLHVSEYGILDDATGETQRCATEEEVYALLGLPWIPPELRENRGELALADGELPVLIELGDLKGDLHMHTDAQRRARRRRGDGAGARASAGSSTSPSPTTRRPTASATTSRPTRCARRSRRSARSTSASRGSRCWSGPRRTSAPTAGPTMTTTSSTLLDWVVGSVHTSFAIGSDAMTDRMIAAIEHPLIDAIGHPTGRKIESRAPYAVDVERLIEAAARTGTMLEINSAPDRRDLNDVHARNAAAAGVMIVIDSDAHGPNTMIHTRWGIATARRAWLRKEDVANTRPWEQFAALSKRAR